MRGKYTLSDEDREALLFSRELQEDMEKMCDGLRELRLLAVSVSSPNMDGMPKGDGVGDAYAQTLARIEQREREIALQKRKIERAKRIARRVLKPFIGPFKAFCEDYYVEGMPFVIAQAASGVGDRQCKNYIAYIQKKASP